MNTPRRGGLQDTRKLIRAVQKVTKRNTRKGIQGKQSKANPNSYTGGKHREVN